MAGDWIKMRIDLQSHPKVVRILSATKSDKFRVIGGLHAVWAIFDTHSIDGVLSGYTPEVLDHIIGWEGFSRAMISVGWLAFDDQQTLTVPEFDEHNGRGGKRRAEDQKRKRISRTGPDNVHTSVHNSSEVVADKNRTKIGLEKRREEKKEQEQGTNVKPGAEKPKRQTKPDRTLADWIASLPEGEMAIPETDPVFESAERAGLPDEFVTLEWAWFKRKYGASTKRYRDWRQVFRNAVDGAWGSLWRPSDNGGYVLTTAGQQLQRALGESQ